MKHAEFVKKEEKKQKLEEIRLVKRQQAEKRPRIDDAGYSKLPDASVATAEMSAAIEKANETARREEERKRKAAERDEKIARAKAKLQKLVPPDTGVSVPSQLVS